MSSSKNLARAVSSSIVVAASGGTLISAFSNNGSKNNLTKDEEEDQQCGRIQIENQIENENENHHPLQTSLISSSFSKPSLQWNVNPSIWHQIQQYQQQQYQQQQQQHISFCEWGLRNYQQQQQQQQQQQPQKHRSSNNDEADLSSYPDLSRFGASSYLKKYLTPKVYVSLQHKTTSNGVTLEDIIRSGVSLPWGARPPRGTGVYAGDEESYQVFAELLVPVIEDYHRYHFAQQQQQQQQQQQGGTTNHELASRHRHRQQQSGNDTTNTTAAAAAAAASVSGPRHLISATTFVTAMSPAMVLDDETPMHGSSSSSSGVMLRRTFTNLNKHSVLEQKLDPTGDYILQTRMRVARSIKGFPFSPVINRKQRRELEHLFETMVDEDWNNSDDDEDDDNSSNSSNTSAQHNNINSSRNDGGGGDDVDIDFDIDIDDDDEFFGKLKIINNHGGLKDGKYLRVMDMANDQHDDLIARHILFHDPDEYNISAGIGRDWPDARGIYLTNNNNHYHNNNPDLMIWLNKEDHMRIIATSNGGDLLAVFKRLSGALTQVEQSLHKRGHAFCVHPRYGFVNTSPENLGTALRASVYIKLYRLGKQPGFEALLERLRLESSSRFENHPASGVAVPSFRHSGGGSGSNESPARYTGIFDIANSERLGQSEIQLVNTMINGVGRLIELEKRLEKGETVNLEEVR